MAQVVPASARAPRSLHAGAVPQLRRPLLHGWVAGTHAAPSTHAPHTPAAHVRFAPHTVPSGTTFPDERHGLLSGGTSGGGTTGPEPEPEPGWELPPPPPPQAARSN